MSAHSQDAPVAPRRRPTAPTTEPAGGERRHVPALSVSEGGPAERFAPALGLRHPVLVFVAGVLCGLAALSAVSILLGLLVTSLTGGGSGLGGADEDVISTIAEHRSGTLTDISWLGSFLGGAPWLPALVGLVAVGFAVARQWLAAAFAVVVLITESASYRITTLVIHRDRPDVVRLDKLPLDDSYPSGHTAATVAVYAGLVFLLSSRLAGTVPRALAWTFAVVMVSFVAASRMYRGMHHPLDVAGGVILGIGAVAVLLFASRAAAAAAGARDSEGARS